MAFSPTTNLNSWNGVAPTAAAALADTTTNPTSPLIGACNEVWNSASWDRMTGTVDGTAFASASRSSTPTAVQITNYNCRGVTCYLNITVMGSGSTLAVKILVVDPVSGLGANLFTSSTFNTTQLAVVLLYPGIAVGSQTTSYQLPRVFQLQVVHSNGNACTYSLGYSLTP